MKRIYWNDIKKVLKSYLIVIVPILAVGISIYSYIFNTEIEKTKEIITEEQKQKAKVINYIIEDNFQEAYENLLVIKNSNEISDYLNIKDEETLSQTEQMFLRISKSKKRFDQIRFIDTEGKEVIRVNSDNDNSYIVTKDQLQYKGDREYYKTTSELSEGKIYVSDLDLNIENEEVEIPYKPEIRIATPMYSDDNNFQGILIVNYLVQDLLNLFDDEFNKSEYNITNSFLINNEGYYLFNKDESKNFGFMFEEMKNVNISMENPNLWAEIKLKDTGLYENNEEVDYYMKVWPLKGLDDKIESDYNWVIVTKYNPNDLPIMKDSIIFGMKYEDILVLIGISILMFIIIVAKYYSKKDKALLNLTERIAEHTSDAVIVTDSYTNIIYVNKSFEEATGYMKEEVLGLKTSYFKSNKQSKEFYHDMWKNLNTKGHWQGELWDKKKGGSLYPKKLSIFEVKNEYNKKIVNYMGIFTDLTKTKKKEEYVVKLQNYNFETNLPNENLLEILIDNNIKVKKDNLFIIYFYIENYNSIVLKKKEDGQAVVNNLIQRIKGTLHEEDFIAQISKNNFVVGVSSLDSKNKFEDFIQKFFEVNKESIYVNEEEVFYDIKAGISIYPKDGTNSGELISNAYLAMEKVIGLKEKKYLFYEDDFKNAIKKEIEMDLLLRKAIVNNELDVYYQPQIKIEEEDIVGAEALIRWNNSELGNVSPVVFIPLAEKTGQIIEIGYWLIEKIFKDYSFIKEELSNDFRISINVSPLQFNDKNLLEKFKELGEKYNVNFNNFEIEITESVLMTDINIVNEYLKKFKELGMTVAIDDFGTGFSSLSYLKNLNVDKLKIDRSFIKDYPEKDSGEIAQVITNMANKLKLKVITEGAETKDQIKYLESIGCDLIQGYYYSRPLEKEDFYKYLRNSYSTKERDSTVGIKNKKS
ncbi:bifunctional diguanylate cyclase/phosphodiesterase [Clostridium grantii]|uniref:PAS domain S-box-containing protein n=1 Tax=Clostridium grantii DSM 8605 TaxID=1121316 RepID=A0A1M5W1H4_9CLOT|nr:EAL domain-containing protein [Clostridium grantii]SHH81278.1 PAS domain S-box-containing protein [Clostridium grantii DSM 8605]